MRMQRLGGMLLGAVLCAMPLLAFAESTGGAYLTPETSGLQGTGEAVYGVAPGESETNLADFIGAYIIKPVLGLVGLIGLVFTVYAGFLWMTAAGDEKKVKKAKDILQSVIIGAVIMVAAYAVTNLVLQGLSPTTTG